MLPDDDLATAWDYVPICLDCDGPLEPGQRYRCRACRAAAVRAIERAGPGVTVTWAMIDEERKP